MFHPVTGGAPLTSPMIEIPTVVCLVDRRRNARTRALRRAGFNVLESFTTDQTVAICVNNAVDCVLLDQEFFLEVDGWSVAQSIKLIKANLCVVLISRAPNLTEAMPRGVDEVIRYDEPQKVAEVIRRLVSGQEVNVSRARPA